MKAPIKVLVTGACGQIGYALTPLIGKGNAFGLDQPVHLVLLDVEPAMQSLAGTKMELEDCAFPLLTQVDITSKPEEAFVDIDYAILVAGAVGLKPGMSRAELLGPNKSIYVPQAKLLDTVAKPSVKVLVVANPANTIARIIMDNVTRIKPSQITCMTRLDHNRTLSQVAYKTKTPHDKVRKIIVWGNHSDTMYADISFSEVQDASGKYVPSLDLIKDEKFIAELPSVVYQRANEVTKARSKSSALSAANAAVDHMKSWTLGTPEEDWVCMGVQCDGSYGLPSGIVFGFPCTCKDGEFSIIKDLKVPEATLQKMKISADELVKEWEISKSC